jgi:IstB-like ATP binding protein
MLPRHCDDSARAGKSGIAFGTGYPPGRSPLAKEKRAAAPWITLRDLVSGRPACHTNKKRWPTVARIQFQITYTNKPFKEWNEVFPNAACVVSLVDRLVHRAEVIAIEGESYRLKEARERAEARSRRRGAKKNGAQEGADE